jgi:exopolyphosphatase/guanosine-5'-triphosphate,3'-diphosphate pyrophosphatase
VFDLGGGSLECLAFRDRKVVQAASLPLGCVRLTEKFVADSSRPLPPDERTALAVHTRTVLSQSRFSFALPAPATAVFAGGSMTSIRAIFGARVGKRMTDAPSVITTGQIRTLLDEVAAQPLAERRRVPGLPEGRADVFPAALVTIETLAAMGAIAAFQHSLYNLRWGLADTILSV